MSEELSLVTELAIILVAAGIFTVISRALRQPLILGYIIAGFLVGPHLGLFPQFSAASVHQWSEIGIIFLLFSLGLEFSFKNLLKVGSSALIMAGCIFAGMFVVGMTCGRAMGWTMMESIFLGGMLSMSSTTIIIKTYDDLGLKNRPYSGLVFGTLVIEDLLAILLMVLLSTMAVSNQFAGGEMIMGIAKLVFFLILWFVVGIYVIPSMLKKAHRYLNDEILLIVSIGLCFLMVVLANLAGFSSALGAFVMGSLLAETIEAERIEHITVHIKELFGAIFFVSVGMMVDPVIIGQHWLSVLVITVITMAGIAFFAVSGVLLAGKGLDNAVHAGLSMAQLGEFAFIIAGVGCTLGVLRDFIYPVIIAVSVITAFATPYVIKLGDPASAWLRRKLPASFLAKVDPPQDQRGAISKAEQSEWKQLLKSYALRVGLYSVLVIAILLASRLYLDKIVEKLLADWRPQLRGLVSTVLTLAIMMPFLYGMAVTNGSISRPALKLLREKPANRWPILALTLLRVIIAIWFMMTVILSHFHPQGWTMAIIILAAFVFFISAKFTMRRFTGLEKQFISNFNDKEERERRRTPVSSTVREALAGYDVHLERITVSQESSLAGKELKDIPFRASTGVNIVKIVRGRQSIVIPSGKEHIFPGDVLIAVGTSAQISSFVQQMEESNMAAPTEDAEEFIVEAVTLAESSYLTGKMLRDTDMRGAGCMVLSCLHDGVHITNPKPDMTFAEGDVVWLAGTRSSIDWYR